MTFKKQPTSLGNPEQIRRYQLRRSWIQRVIPCLQRYQEDEQDVEDIKELCALPAHPGLSITGDVAPRGVRRDGNMQYPWRGENFERIDPGAHQKAEIGSGFSIGWSSSHHIPSQMLLEQRRATASSKEEAGRRRSYPPKEDNQLNGPTETKDTGEIDIWEPVEFSSRSGAKTASGLDASTAPVTQRKRNQQDGPVSGNIMKHVRGGKFTEDLTDSKDHGPGKETVGRKEPHAGDSKCCCIIL